MNIRQWDSQIIVGKNKTLKQALIVPKFDNFNRWMGRVSIQSTKMYSTLDNGFSTHVLPGFSTVL